MSPRKRSITAAVINLVIFAATALCLVSYFTDGGSGNMKDFGLRMFRYFTVDSNVLCAVSAICLVPFELKAAVSRSARIPKWAQVFKFIGTVTVTLTFLVVAVFLYPMTGDLSGMFGEANLHMHLVGPLLAVYSFCFLENDNMLEKRKRWLPLIPVIIYGTVYLIMVVVIGQAKGGWEDFYMFYMDGRWYISYAAIVAASGMICLAEFAVNQRRFRNVRRA